MGIRVTFENTLCRNMNTRGKHGAFATNDSSERDSFSVKPVRKPKLHERRSLTSARKLKPTFVAHFASAETSDFTEVERTPEPRGEKCFDEGMDTKLRETILAFCGGVVLGLVLLR